MAEKRKINQEDVKTVFESPYIVNVKLPALSATEINAIL